MGKKLNFQIELFKFLSDEKVSLDVGKLIQQMRMEKKLTQKDLATVRWPFSYSVVDVTSSNSTNYINTRMVSVGSSKNESTKCQVFLFTAALILSGFSSATQRCSFRVIFRPQHTWPVWPEYGLQLYWTSQSQFQGHSQDFSKRGSQRLLVMLSRDTIRGSPTIYGLYRCTPSCISGLSHIIAAWRPILTKDKSRSRKYFTKK